VDAVAGRVVSAALMAPNERSPPDALYARVFGVSFGSIMALHLIKLCVGAESIADLEEWVAERVAERVRRGGAPRSQHVTRMVPTRAAELVDGGSLYWVIKGQLAARQRLLEIEPFVGDDGIRRCRLWLDPDVAPIRPRPMRPFQGWRYFTEEDAPADLTAAGAGAADMPEELRRALGELGLL
jgi:hypothetical protein